MNLLLDLEILGWLLVGMAGLECIPIAAALISGEPNLAYIESAATALVFGLPVALSARSPNRRMRIRDGFLVVSGAWVLASVFGSIPYVLSGTLSPVDALFESVSGFTTTGSTVLTDIESTPRALLLWRSLTQWVGGMGIIVFAVAVLPLLGIGGMQLFKAEVPGPITDKLTPRVSDTARRLWLVYVGFTALAFVTLMIAGMPPFDAINHALTALATGGFSTRSASIGAFGPAVQWVVAFFMMIAGINFVLHYQVVTGRPRALLRDTEFRFFLLIVAVMIAAVAWILRGGAGAGEVLRNAAFQVVALITTTGYGTADYELWPQLAQLLVFPLLVLGGMAGSTAGGIKSLRVLLGLRALRATVARIIHPHLVRKVRYSNRSVSDEVVSGIGVFFVAYLMIAFIAAVVVGSAGYDVVTCLSAALTSVGNVGPGLGAIGPSDHFAHFPGYVKGVLAVAMIAGRLEIFTVLVLFFPRFWRR
jgi:trk system potassium uptake protein TrkH